MKTRLLVATSIVCLAAFVSSCTEKKQEASGPDVEAEMEHASTSAAPAEAVAPTFEVSNDFQNQLAAVFTSYVNLKEAFVATDAAKVRTEAAMTQKVLSKVDMKLLSGAAHNDWMTYQTGLADALAEMQGTTDIEVQRTAFSKLSDNLYKSIKAFGLGGTPVYYEFCPMAFDNQGGYWLSDNDAIRNPYFGDMMLKCGSVQEKL